MKKKKFANLIMVLVILAVAALGVGLALKYRTAADNGLGTLYHITPLENNALIEAGQEDNLCTITIRCDTVLRHLDTLSEGKIPYVPEDGMVLAKATVSFAPGDTVFDVLQKVCAATELPLEYSWTPLYDSYYVEGINHLYEFDCGATSGWMFQVNDWFPNYGCSAYTLENGDDIVWCYTCVGLGEDVGETRVGNGQ